MIFVLSVIRVVEGISKGSTSVSLCICWVFVSDVYAVVILSAVFCVSVVC